MTRISRKVIYELARNGDRRLNDLNEERNLRSYTSTRMGILQRLAEFRQLYTYQKRNIPGQVKTLIERLQRANNDVMAIGGRPFRDLDVLEIGPGQRFRQLSYFARFNRVIGIDLDELVQGVSLISLAKMLRHNGPIRAIKTYGRRLLGIDRAFEREMDNQLGIRRPPRYDIRRMDAAQMAFPANSFDLIYSYSVFEHIPDCRKVLTEVKRVLRPGGCVYISLHLYTSESGCHDPRIFAGKREMLPLWAHLRPQHASKVRPNAYLNKLRMKEWDSLFEECLPGVIIQHHKYGEWRLRPEIEKLRQSGELNSYEDEELLTTDYVALWRKPEQ
ncbi:MAG: hypothetical protein KatS3mg104_0166 [Phycisphaerae bacterium]|nr:MAG: hypothetical protein KatS3mg104_0166 [Phycisphaerae bacterium]